MVNQLRAVILKALREGEGYISGEALSRELGISRVSIWKHVHSLQQDGYTIEASPKGYCLISSPDLLLPYEFPGLERKIHHFAEVGSTMDSARELAKSGAEEGTIVIAETQSHGRGRLSREWLSPQGGIHLTIVLRPQITPAYAPRINLMASVAVAKTITRLFGLKAELKWPNDVLIEGKKVCGILAEMDAEMDKVNYINLGIGLNANNLISAEEKNATSLREQLGGEISRKEFCRSLLQEINAQQALLNEADLLEEWKKFSATLNREVRITTPGEEIEGKAIDIDSYGALIVKTHDGSPRNVFAGDCIHLDS
jgi:BirA family biotin operon repressor/biotin-[acetyl-CoA-carboxylase] ligase